MPPNLAKHRNQYREEDEKHAMHKALLKSNSAMRMAPEGGNTLRLVFFFFNWMAHPPLHNSGTIPNNFCLCVLICELPPHFFALGVNLFRVGVPGRRESGAGGHPKFSRAFLQSHGWIVYEAIAVAALETHVTTRTAVEADAHGLSLMRRENDPAAAVVARADGDDGRHVLKHYVSSWRRAYEGIRPPTALHLTHVVAGAVVNGRHSLLQAVAIPSLNYMVRECIPIGPSRHFLRQFAQQHALRALPPSDAGAALPTSAPTLKPRGGCRSKASRPAHELIVWLEATRGNKHVFEANDPLRAWARVFAINGEVPADRLVATTRTMRPDTLRKARIILDFVACLILRHHFASLQMSSVNMFLYFDGSPQWRGVEIFCSSIDWATSAGDLRRRMLPVISLERGMLSTFKKTCALLWQLWLISGGSREVFLSYLTRIRSATTDMGVEAGVIDAPASYVDAFLAELKLPPVSQGHGPWMCPRALQAPGWRHMWGNVLRHTCNGLDFSPASLNVARLS